MGFCRKHDCNSFICFIILRIIYLAENQKTKFSRVYGYCVASYLFTHFYKYSHVDKIIPNNWCTSSFSLMEVQVYGHLNLLLSLLSLIQIKLIDII